MKKINITSAFFLFVAVLVACSPALSNLPASESLTYTTTPTNVLISTSTSVLSMETSIAAAELSTETSIAATAIHFRPVETYYEEIKVAWLECEVPLEYYHDWRFAATCLHTELPAWQEENRQRLGERFQRPFEPLQDLRLVIGKDVYETKHQGSIYELMKNEITIATANSIFSVFDPNRALLSADNKIVWELVGFNSDQTVLISAVIYDGANLLEKFSLEGAYIPYVINDKLTFVAKKAGRFHVMYDEQNLGPEFDEISIGYCCSSAAYSILRVQNQYWFWGTRDGKYFVVALFSK